MVRITDPERSCAFYEALGLTFAGDFDIVRDGEVEATNYFFSLGDHESVLELTYNHDGRTYDLGTAYGHIAVGVDDLDGTLARLREQGIEPEREPYSVREGGSRLTFVRDPDDTGVEIAQLARNFRAPWDVELALHVPVVGDAVAPFMIAPDTDPAALRAIDSLAILPAAASEEIQRRREEIGFSYFVFGAGSADTLAPVVAALVGH
jgi:lactoylglutathione lyase